MEHQDYLLTIAEVATAFVGFSMLINAIGSQSDQRELRRSMLYDVAQIGFIVIGSALAPYAIASAELPIDLVWRGSSGLLFVTWVVAARLAHRRIYGIGGEEGVLEVLGVILTRISTPLVIAGNLLLVWNVLFPDEYSGTRYMGALLILLLIATYIFLRAGFSAVAKPD